MASLTVTEERARLVLRKLKAWTELSDDEIGRRAGISRQSVSYRMNGRLKIGIDELDAFAAVFDVPRDLFFMSHYDAIRWVIDRDEAQELAATMTALPIRSRKFAPLPALSEAA